jgi:small-conductance mechanosensitive channel
MAVAFGAAGRMGTSVDRGRIELSHHRSGFTFSDATHYCVVETHNEPRWHRGCRRAGRHQEPPDSSAGHPDRPEYAGFCRQGRIAAAQAWVIIIGIQVAIWLNRAINAWMEKVIDPNTDPDLRNRATTTTMVFILRLAVLLVVLLMVLANLGINITAFVASLGIGGVAIALALQNILSDLFASLSIGLDKPFEIGDFIIVDDLMGTVEYIGVKTTRLRSLSGEQLIRSNTELLKSAIHNYKRMSERRVVFKFGIATKHRWNRSPSWAPSCVTIILAQKPVRFDRAHFMNFGDSSLDFEVVYYVLSSDLQRLHGYPAANQSGNHASLCIAQYPLRPSDHGHAHRIRFTTDADQCRTGEYTGRYRNKQEKRRPDYRTGLLAQSAASCKAMPYAISNTQLKQNAYSMKKTENTRSSSSASSSEISSHHAVSGNATAMKHASKPSVCQTRACSPSCASRTDAPSLHRHGCMPCCTPSRTAPG